MFGRKKVIEVCFTVSDVCVGGWSPTHAGGLDAPGNVAPLRHWFRPLTAPSSVACGSEIMTVNSPSGSTLQCDTWLRDDMPVNSLKRSPYWNSTSGFHFHTSPQSTCHSVPVCEILSKSDHPDYVSAILDCRDPIMGSLKSQLSLHNFL